VVMVEAALCTSTTNKMYAVLNDDNIVLGSVWADSELLALEKAKTNKVVEITVENSPAYEQGYYDGKTFHKKEDQ
jgi:hypothetical protein